jgi:3-oxoacyl-[acyl-carrier-protein] synthase II
VSARDVLITGIGLVTSLGEGVERHVAAIRDGEQPKVDTTTYAPYPVHIGSPLELDRQIPKKADQRQMEGWQRLGVYAAGLALDSAGLKDDVAAKAELQLIVAAGGGERDQAVDAQILTGLRDASDKDAYLNEHLMGDLRPTLFLAQLSNLLAGNISIVHGVTGASRTFMGEEQAGVDALRTATARIASGQDDAIMVGGAYNAERWDMMTLYELGLSLWRGEHAPVAERAANGGGMITGSVGAFLVLESRAKAEARGAKAIAKIDHVGASRSRRVPGGISAGLETLLSATGTGTFTDTVVSAATGLAPITAEEFQVLDRRAPHARRIMSGDLIGHSVEAAFPAAVALAAGLLAAGDTRSALVTGVGHWRGEGVALLSPVKPRGTA